MGQAFIPRVETVPLVRSPFASSTRRVGGGFFFAVSFDEIVA
jgi:hypothetical protein